MTKSGRKCFTKIRRWAEEIGAKIDDSEYFDSIIITLPNGKKFKAEQQFDSTSSRVINRGRGHKWVGNPAGFYFGHLTGRYDYTFESTQKRAIEEMEDCIKGIGLYA